MKYNNANKEEGGLRYANTYSVDDTVGCGINIQTGKLFFTKNGVNLGRSKSKTRVSKKFTDRHGSLQEWRFRM